MGRHRPPGVPVTPLVVLLIVALLLFASLRQLSRHERKALGIGTAVIVSADDSELVAPILRSARYGLVGRPDHLVRIGRTLIPVEQKPSAHRVQSSHVLQVAAQCLLVYEVYGVRPPYGLLVLAGGVREQIQFTPSLERRLLETMSQMRQLLNSGVDPGPRWVAQKCRRCGFRRTCWG
jgi:CRISPR-associated exonuclease Cas4